VGGYEVDPARLAASGKTVGAQGDALIAALNALDSAWAGSGLMCGTDEAGLTFFIDYRKGGQAVISAAESAVNAFRNVGYGVEVSAHNYAVSDAVSTIGGGRESIPVPAEPTKYTASGVPGQSGAEIPQPSLWSMVQQFVGGAWPNGNPETMRAVAGGWRAVGTAISTASGDAGDCLSSLAGHDIPELARINEALNTLTSGTSDLAGKCNSIAESLDSFAGEVQSSQDAIRDLLHRLSVSGILSELGKIFTGHNPMDDLRKIGHDISEILHTLSRELDAAAAGFQMLIDGMDGLVRTFEEWDRKEFTRFFGDQVGNVLADGVNAYADIEEGLAKSVLEVGQSIPAMLAHPADTVKGILELDKDAVEFLNPLAPILDSEGQKEAGEHLLDTVKGVVDYKDWSSDRPLVGLGDNFGNIAQVVIPGVGEAKAGVTAGKIGEEGAQAARVDGTAARGGLKALGETSGKELADQAGKIGKDLDGLGAKPLEVPKAEPVARPAESGPAPGAKPADGGAAAGNPGAGKAPVDAGARPGGESAPAAHEPGTSPHGGEPHSSGAAPHGGGAEPPAGTHGHPEAGGGGGRGGGGDHGATDGSQDFDQTGHDGHHSVLDQSLTPEMRDEILDTPKGERPDPSEYLPHSYIEQHLHRFDDGVTRFMPEDSLDKYGIAQRDGTSFVMPKAEADELLAASQGDPKILERALGLPEGFFDSKNLMRIDVANPRDYDLRLPSGNEAGANDQWIPGGELPDGSHEAIIDGGEIPDNGYTVAEIETN
jgi:hypothetical protein